MSKFDQYLKEFASDNLSETMKRSRPVESGLNLVSTHSRPVNRTLLHPQQSGLITGLNLAQDPGGHAKWMYVRVSRHVVITSEWLQRLETNNAGQQGGTFNWLSPNSPIIVPEYNPTLESWLQIRLGSDRGRRAATKDQPSAEIPENTGDPRWASSFLSRHPDLGVNSNGESQTDPTDLFYSSQDDFIQTCAAIPAPSLGAGANICCGCLKQVQNQKGESWPYVTHRAREFNEKTGILVKMNL